MINDTFTGSAKVHTALKIIYSICDAIKDLGSIPSGTLYAHLMTNNGMSLEQYNQVISILVEAGKIKIQNNLIIWVK